MMTRIYVWAFEDKEHLKAYAEEVEEAESELERIKEEMADLWQNVKQNDNAAVTDALRRISTHAYFMLQETTQIVAVANKFRGD